MSWYSKYLSIYNVPLNKVSGTTIKEIQYKLKALESANPLVSIVLIAHNEETRLLSCLWSLSENRCNFPIEILGVNNNSTDKTTEAMTLAGIKWFDEPQKGPGHARQCGLNNAKGKYYICIDADTMYPPQYIQTLTDQLKKPGIACVFSLWSFIPDDKHSKWGLIVYELLRDSYLKIQSWKRPEMCVRGMVFGFNTELGRKVGFRTDIIRGEDGSLAFGLKKYGKLLFITKRKARAITGNNTLNADGSFFNSFKIRLIKALKGVRFFFIKRPEYKDEDSNLIK